MKTRTGSGPWALVLAAGILSAIAKLASAQGLPATLVHPSAEAVGVGLNETFSWTSVASAEAYDLAVGTFPGGNDVAESGHIQQTSYLVVGLPAGRRLYARIWTKQSDGWKYSQIGFSTAAQTGDDGKPIRVVVPPRNDRHFPQFSRLDGSDTARLTYPVDGSVNADPALPFEWTEVQGATYRLVIGSRPAASDLHDTGEIRYPKRFIEGLPEGQTLYATLSTKIHNLWRSTDFSFSFGAPSSHLEPRIDAALWATHYVRRMADDNNYPLPSTPLEERLTSEGYSGAFCTDYAATLYSALQEMNAGLEVRFLNVFMNTNFYDAHTLVEVFHPLQNDWILLDPTFDMTMRRASDGLWATAADMTRATLNQRWSDIVYVPLGPEGLRYANSYYLDYPLLYLNPLPSPISFVPGRGNSPLPYFEELSTPPSGAPGVYAVRAIGAPAVDISVDGSEYFFSCQGIDSLSQAFPASSIEATPQSPPDLAIYRLRRFVF